MSASIASSTSSKKMLSLQPPLGSSLHASSSTSSHSPTSPQTSTTPKTAQDYFVFANDSKRQALKGKNQHQQLIQQHSSHIQDEIQRSKQQIVKHVLQSRQLEQVKSQITLVQDALQSHLLTKSDPEHWLRIMLRKQAISQDFSILFEENVLYQLGKVLGWMYPPLVLLISTALRDYNDEHFSEILDSIPLPEHGVVTIDMYQQIVESASGGLISSMEAKQLYDRVEDVFRSQRLKASTASTSTADHTLSSTTAITNSNKKWQLLKLFLRKKILLLHLTKLHVQYVKDMEDKLKQKHFQFPQLTTSSVTSGMVLTSTASSSQLSPRLPLSGIPDGSVTTASSQKMMLSKTMSALPNMTTAMSVTSASSKQKPTKGSKPITQPSSLRAKLQKELAMSLQKQTQLKDKITEDMAKFYLDGIEPPLTATTASSSASLGTADAVMPNTTSSMKTNGTAAALASPAVQQYFRNQAVQRIGSAMDKYVWNIARLRFIQWKEVQLIQLTEIKIHHFLKHTAALRVLRMWLWNYVRKLHHRFEKWKAYTSFFTMQERLSSAITIQRYVRGYHSRKRMKEQQEIRAVVMIQNVIRIFIAKQLSKKLLHRVKVKKSVLKIEKLWKNHQWNRAIKKAFEFQKKMRSIGLIQRCYRGFVGRKRWKKYALRRQKKRAALQFQCVYRRYRAILRVESLRVARRRHLAAIKIQAMVRSKLARLKFHVKLHRHYMALVIQYSFWCYKARCETARRRRKKAAIIIQRRIRGIVARQRVIKLRIRRMEAIKKITPLGLGYITRRRWRKTLKAHLERRQQAARKIQKLLKAIYLGHQARKIVREMRADRQAFERKVQACKNIQRIVRGKLGRNRVQRLRQQLEIERAKQKAIPLYYRMKDYYYKGQNMYHRKPVITIQCMVRRYLAKKKAVRQKRRKSVAKIETFYISMKLIEEAKSIRRELARRKSTKQFGFLKIQGLVRMFLAKKLVEKRRAAKVLHWGIMEMRVVKMTRDAIETFRARKREAERRRRAATKVQAIIRGILGRKKFKKAHRSLLRQRALRIRAKKEKAALVIQCAYRCHRARKRVAKQRILLAEREQERRENAELEKMIEGFHESWLQELLAIRAQSGVRAHLARQEFFKRVAAHKEQIILDRIKKKDQAAAKVQALIRGVISRKRHKKNLPALKKALKMKAYCVECEAKIATRRCRQCRDRFCNECYVLLHQKGKRKEHSFENIKIDARLLAMSFDEQEGKKDKKKDKAEKVNKRDWEEFFDTEAKAKYWFNKKTGEASWICPY